jgi:hypothetical protein
MKFSVSVPDDLWAAVHTDASGPSDTVQRGLRALLDQQRAASVPMANAPDPALREQTRDRFEAAVLIASGMTTSDFELIDSRPDRLIADIRQALTVPETWVSAQEISYEFREHVVEIMDVAWGDQSDVPAEKAPLREELDEVFGYENEPAPGIRWVPMSEFEDNGKAEKMMVPVFSDLYGDGILAALADVRDEAIRRIHSEKQEDQ